MTISNYLTIPLRTEEQARADRAKRCADILAAWDMDEVATILNALSAADEQDFDYLASRLGDGGRDRFWKAVISELRPVFSSNEAKPSGSPTSPATVIDLPVCEVDVMVGAGVNRL